ncbi:hypothetical protein [Flavilitoribacter nigricans]|uniref:Tetratricopeptide repeat protein n=1 Tax=Flavilitoribacter nigricans (strain ATCC 23147 / DSM 23189 / NBRC 102662 / NCIMB 1420 / SS-2) TaxID=1122177 RepID=A0A2D0NIS2_FLAN2|nr:hypothetical protein [Flavilitoribacter nigricans]PHN08089.1 hypothetical protein CRP01_03475 [Flavilitoribacter nigricans DSM 23189 = NBRC 102662]
MADHNDTDPQSSSNDPGYFRYTDRPGEHEAVVPIMDSEKYRQAKAVYDRLVQAKGDFRYPIPEFVMSRDERMVAWMDYDGLQIGLEEKAYDVCQNFGGLGDAAMATLLGHELTHYYEKHAWRRGFAANFQDLDIGVKLDKIRDNVLNETQADYLGGFLAYSAGYPVFDQTPDFMTEIYKAYGFPEELGDNYPSLSDRQVLARRSGERMKQLITIFDMANWLNAIGSFAEAKLYYRYILREYQSRELYNNLGILYVREALEKFTTEEVRFLFPLELDLATMRGSSREVDPARLDLLREAILQFDYAISMDPDYAPAYLNKACAYTLLGDIVRAKFYAETEALHRAVGSGNNKVVSDSEVLLGIIASLQQDDASAQDYFNKAMAKNNTLAGVNKDILLGKPVQSPEQDRFPEERIDGIDLLDFSEGPSYDEDLSLAITDTMSLLQNPHPGGEDSRSRIFIHYNAAQSLIICIQMTDPEYTGETAKGISRGATTGQIVEQYGEPIGRLGSPRGDILVYSNLLFLVDEQKGLESWATYLSQNL